MIQVYDIWKGFAQDCEPHIIRCDQLCKSLQVKHVSEVSNATTQKLLNYVVLKIQDNDGA